MSPMPSLSAYISLARSPASSSSTPPSIQLRENKARHNSPLRHEAGRKMPPAQCNEIRSHGAEASHMSVANSQEHDDPGNCNANLPVSHQHIAGKACYPATSQRSLDESDEQHILPRDNPVHTSCIGLPQCDQPHVEDPRPVINNPPAS
ncbi:hypothetical protein RRF57_011798 [Xylaria bambusicola]|uniref:Uncharacterized protein n=1 Tax=Xylaria bambusicola TaxID=326684 RepID=A0AAN7UZY6_9PEZI